MRNSDFYKTANVLAVIVLTIALFILHASFTQDDAFISLRYAQNAANGYGLRFNVDQDPVEGYTNFSWVILLTVPFFLKFDPVIYIKCLGSLCALGIVLAYIRTSRCLIPDHVIAPVSYWIIALNLPFSLWAVSGLETTCFALMCFMSLTAGMRILETQTVRSAVVWSIGAFLTRPDGVLAVVTLMAILFFEAIRNRNIMQCFIRYLLCVGTAASAYLLWKYYYFDGIIPNTFHAKVQDNIGERIADGFMYFSGWFLHWGWPLLVFSFLAFLDKKHLRMKSVLLFFSVVYLAYIVYIGGDFMQFQRFFVPVLAPLLLLASTGIRNCLEQASFPGKRWMKIPLFIALAAGLISYMTPHLMGHYAAVENFNFHDLTQESSHRDTQIGTWMKEKFPADTTVAIFNIGRIPYYTGFTTIDTLGLIDREIAGYIQSNDLCRLGTAVLKREPDVIIPQQFRIEQQSKKVWWHFFQSDWRGSRQMTDLIHLLQSESRRGDEMAECPEIVKQMETGYMKKTVAVSGRPFSAYLEMQFAHQMHSAGVL